MELEALDDLYRDIILDHYRRPRHAQKLSAPDIQAEGNNPFCGDEITLQIKLDDGHIQDVGFQGRGCSISQASGSMMASLLKGKTLEEVRGVSSTFRSLMQGEKLSQEDMDTLGELEALEGVRQFPVRIKCALLAWATLEDGIQRYEGGK